MTIAYEHSRHDLHPARTLCAQPEGKENDRQKPDSAAAKQIPRFVAQ